MYGLNRLILQIFNAIFLFVQISQQLRVYQEQIKIEYCDEEYCKSYKTELRRLNRTQTIYHAEVDLVKALPNFNVRYTLYEFHNNEFKLSYLKAVRPLCHLLQTFSVIIKQVVYDSNIVYKCVNNTYPKGQYYGDIILNGGGQFEKYLLKGRYKMEINATDGKKPYFSGYVITSVK